MSLIWRLIGPSRLIQYCFRTERWFDNSHTVARFKVMSTQDIIRAEAALWTLLLSCRSPLLPHQLKLIEEVFAHGGLAASPEDHDYATKLKRNVESCEYDLHIDKVLELASSLPAASPRMWNIVACMLDHCGREEHWNPQKHFQIMVGHIIDEQCPSDVLPYIVEVLLVSRSKFRQYERIQLPHRLRESVFAGMARTKKYTSSSRRLDLLTRLVDMFVQWSE